MDIPGEVSFNPVTAPPDEKSYVIVVCPNPVWVKQISAIKLKIVLKLIEFKSVLLKLLNVFIAALYRKVMV